MRTLSIALAGIFLAFALAAFPSMALGQPPTPIQVESPKPFVELIPQLKRLGAPDWVKSGLRLTYYSAISITPHRTHYWFPDESGDWVDETGKRYGRGDMPGAAGHGLTQVTVAALDAENAVMDVQAFGFSRFTGPPVHLISVGQTSMPAFGSDYWIHPAVLNGLPASLGPRTKCVKMATTIEGKKYQAIRFQHESGDARFVWMYELETGLLLHVNHAVHGREGTTLTHMNFRSKRLLDLPWMNKPLPEVLGRVNSLDFEGTQMQPMGGDRVFSRNVSAEAIMRKRAPSWQSYDLRIIEAMLPGMPPNETRVMRVTGMAMIGGLALPPDVLAKLEAGQLLDTDPMTRCAVRVKEIGPVRVVISESGEQHRFEYVYSRRTGLLIGWSRTDPHLFGRETRLTLRAEK